jgi:YggT family protein
MSESPLMLLATTLSTTLSVYTGLLIIRVLLTWFPAIDWYSQPFQTLAQVTDPYLNLFRSLIPPLGGMDLSPMLAILALQVATGVITQVFSSLLAPM